MKPIVFLSDFGSRDPYVGVVKGVIASITGGSIPVIDLTHDIPSFNIVSAAYVLFSYYKYFPKDSIFLVVVDPGVGTSRRAIVIRSRHYYFVAPDNGVVWPAANDDGIVWVREIDYTSKLLPKAKSHTFHARDVFAPIVAYLAMGIDENVIGPLINPSNIIRLSLVDECRLDNQGCLNARAIYIDHFGNVALSLLKECYRTLCKYGVVRVIVGDKDIEAKCGRTFGDVAIGDMIVYVNSAGFIEIAVNQGDASKRLGLSVNDRVRLCLK